MSNRTFAFSAHDLQETVLAKLNWFLVFTHHQLGYPNTVSTLAFTLIGTLFTLLQTVKEHSPIFKTFFFYFWRFWYPKEAHIFLI